MIYIIVSVVVIAWLATRVSTVDHGNDTRARLLAQRKSLRDKYSRRLEAYKKLR